MPKQRTIEHTCPDCGSVHDVVLPKGVNQQRSIKEHNILFGYIGLCCDNWPEQYDYQPQNGDPEHLRAWALIRIGHCKELPVYSPGHNMMPFMRIIAAFVTDRYYEAHDIGGVPTLLVPRSISTGKGGVSRKEYNHITHSIEELLEPICGISVDDYKRHKMKMSPAEKPAHYA